MRRIGFDVSCLNCMIGNKEKLQNLSKYKESHVVATTNNLKLSITYINSMVVYSQYNATNISFRNSDNYI